MQVGVESVGVSKWELDTPALLLDLDAMERNLNFMADFCREKSCNLRPHIKTHKTPYLAHRQIEVGAIGITCQKLEEAELFSACGFEDILLTYEVVAPRKIRRLVELAKRTRVIGCVDDEKNVLDLSHAAQAAGAELSLLVEVNVGQNRCGVEPGRPSLDLARKVIAAPALRFRGLLGYAGFLMGEEDRTKRESGARQATGHLVASRELLEGEGIEVEICSAGGTGTYNIDAGFPGVTEIQPGSYLTMDAKYHRVVPEFECALTALTTVVSRPAKDRAILDVGSKSITPDYDRFGIPEARDLDGLLLSALHEEHGLARLENPSRDLRPGDVLELIPGHGCSTLSLHDRLYGVRGETVEAIWPIAARGLFR
jgi:D-serine deaminase-like pyridoxal phosphate-dependent protein